MTTKRRTAVSDAPRTASGGRATKIAGRGGRVSHGQVGARASRDVPSGGTGGATAAAAEKKMAPVSFRPTVDERRVLDELGAEGVTASDALRHGLRLLVQERWLEQARADMLAHRDENLNDEPDAW